MMKKKKKRSEKSTISSFLKNTTQTKHIRILSRSTKWSALRARSKSSIRVVRKR